jgi:hypothetical protein
VVTDRQIKKKEIEISHFYDWNICMMTFYDYLEQFMVMGMLFDNDVVLVRKEEPQATGSGDRSDGTAEAMGGTGGSGGGSEKGERVDVKRMGQDRKNELVESMERRCLDLAQQISKNFLSDATVQKEIAFLVVATSRKEHGVVMYNSEFIQEYYRVILRDRVEFEKSVVQLMEECKSNADHLQFDLVIRHYNQQGAEILPEHLMRQAQKKHQMMVELAKEKLKEQAQPAPLQGAVPAPSPNHQTQLTTTPEPNGQEQAKSSNSPKKIEKNEIYWKNQKNQKNDEKTPPVKTRESMSQHRRERRYSNQTGGQRPPEKMRKYSNAAKINLTEQMIVNRRKSKEQSQQIQQKNQTKLQEISTAKPSTSSPPKEGLDRN